jgi:phenylpropionate dioxygenase-like ring-hydroxylating dioxygenase large terminal subunit
MSVGISASDLRHALPALGLREFWYPAGRSKEFGRRPVGRKLLGADIVFLREPGGVHALSDRCPHRGMPLSCGDRRFEGTITCPYHGWTFNMHGECVAALNEGPESPIPGKVRVRTYPVEERNGVVWVFMGDGPPKPLSDDVPEELLAGRSIIDLRVAVWKCGWLPAIENLVDSHDVIAHRTSAFYLFRKLPSWVKVGATETADGKGVDVRYEAMGPVHDIYPNIGRWPRRSWYRRLGMSSPNSGHQGLSQLRLPSLVRAAFPRMNYVRWTVPIDEKTVRVFLFASTNATGLAALRNRLSYWLWMSWSFMTQILNQDQRLFEGQDYFAPEQLSQTDVGIIKWRRVLAACAQREAQQRANG